MKVFTRYRVEATKRRDFMQDEKIVELYFERDEQALSETEAKYGRYLYKIA